MAETHMAEKAKISVSWQDLNGRKVEARLKEQEALARNRAYAQLNADSLPDEAAPASAPRKAGLSAFFYNSVVYMSVFGLLGGLAAWAMLTLVLQLEPTGQRERADTLLDGIRDVQKQVAAERMTAEEAELVIAQIRRAGSRNPYFIVSANSTMSEAEKQQRLAQVSKGDAQKQFIAR